MLQGWLHIGCLVRPAFMADLVALVKIRGSATPLQNEHTGGNMFSSFPEMFNTNGLHNAPTSGSPES